MNTHKMNILVERLAQLQACRKEEETAANNDPHVLDCDVEVTRLEKRLVEARANQARYLDPYTERVADIELEIAKLHDLIVEAWDGVHRTLEYGNNTLRFKTTHKTVVHRPDELVKVIINTLPAGYVPKYLPEYIQGFKLTKLKQWMKLYPQPADIIGLVPKTSVTLEVIK